MQHKFKLAFMDTAKRFAQLSSAQRLQVGAIVVKDDRIVSIGYNGTPAGWDNICEHLVDVSPDDPRYDPLNFTKELKTRPEVLHAERNALDKLARGHESGLGATLFVTHSPCLECAKSIYGAGIKEVYYDTDYRDKTGIEFLKQCNVKVEKFSDD